MDQSDPWPSKPGISHATVAGTADTIYQMWVRRIRLQSMTASSNTTAVNPNQIFTLCNQLPKFKVILLSHWAYSLQVFYLQPKTQTHILQSTGRAWTPRPLILCKKIPDNSNMEIYKVSVSLQRMSVRQQRIFPHPENAPYVAFRILKAVPNIPSDHPQRSHTAFQLNVSNPEAVSPLTSRCNSPHARFLPFCSQMRTSHQPAC